MRSRRTHLRKLGFSSKTDVPNFINSNLFSFNIKAPDFDIEEIRSLNSFSIGDAEAIDIGYDRLVVRLQEGLNVQAWFGICPHEGAELSCSHLKGDKIKCPWHGLEFNAVAISPGETRSIGKIKIFNDGEDLRISRESMSKNA